MATNHWISFFVNFLIVNCRLDRKYIAITDYSLSWQEANSYCKNVYSSELATIESIQDYNEFSNTITRGLTPQTKYWIGMNDILKEGEWIFADGTKCTTTDYCWTLWRKDEPNNLNNEDCTVYDSGINDMPCWNTGQIKFVCNYYIYPFLYHDTINTISNVSIVSSSNCPSTSLKTIIGRKLCISNSNKSRWDGLYVWEYDNKDSNVSIYHSIDTNKYILDFSYALDSSYHEYQIHDYETQQIVVAKCENVNNIFDCIGKWQIYDVVGEWYVDTNIITTTCSDICVKYNDWDFCDGIYVYHHWDQNVSSNVYFCDNCHIFKNSNYWNHLSPGITYGLYMLGWIQNGLYQWIISNDYRNLNSSQIFSKCIIGHKGVGYVFHISDCFIAGLWDIRDPWNINNAVLTDATWVSDSDMMIYDCSSFSNQRLDELSSLQQGYDSKICIESSMTDAFDGEYKFLYFNVEIGGIIYYNTVVEKYLYPRSYQYVIDGDARCNFTNNSQINLDVTECIGKWEIYYDNIWYNDIHMTSVDCQDVCLFSGDYNFIYDGVIFSWIGFDALVRSNIYECTDCWGSGTQYVYLFGTHVWWLDQYAWFIGPQYNESNGWMWCEIGAANEMDNEYVFNFDICNVVGSWKVFMDPGWVISKSMKVLRCNEEISIEQCVELSSTSELHLSYQVDSNYSDFAIGFDINSERVDLADKAIIEYSCNQNDNSYQILTVFDFEFKSMSQSRTHIVYKINTDQCRHLSNMVFKFGLIDTELTSRIYINNIYLYYNVSDILFSSNDADESWRMNTINSDNNSNETLSQIILMNNSVIYCELNSECSITRSINTNKNGYFYKDFNLYWSLRTNGLGENSIFNVEIQCDNNYLYVNKLCILKQYSSINDCTNNLCSNQSYNLPIECDFSKQIIVKFNLETMETTDVVYVDYVYLTHSDKSGNISPLCRTQSPTGIPTNEPTKTPTIEPTLNPTFAQVNVPVLDETELTLVFVGALAFLLCLIIICVCLYMKHKYRGLKNNEMSIENAMIILIGISEYDKSPKDPDIELQNVSIADLNVEETIKNMCRLFNTEHLNYSVFPTCKESQTIKTHWTEEEIINLLEQKAEDLNNNITVENAGKKRFDGLFVAILSVGIEGHIVTSDMKIIEKFAIHRIFSKTIYADSRQHPRLFAFHTYCIDNQIQIKNVSNPQCDVLPSNGIKFDNNENGDQGKGYGLDDVGDGLWLSGTKNPDYKLAEIYVETTTSESKNDYIDDVLSQFATKIVEDPKLYLYQVFDDITKELSIANNTTIKTTFNDQTRYVRFKKNVIASNENAQQSDTTELAILEQADD
eukprot:27585_1